MQSTQIRLGWGLPAILLMANHGWAEVPKQISYQGVVAVNGARYDGPGTFFFALFGADGNNVWTNDGTSLGTANRPVAGVQLAVTDGVFSVALGDSALSMQPINPSTFQESDIKLRIWFNDGPHGTQQLSPEVLLASAPYAHAVHGIVITQSGDQERVGINTPTPALDTTLHIVGTGTSTVDDTGRIRLESFDKLRKVDLRTDGSHIDIESSTSNIYINNLASSGPNQGNVFINPHSSGGKVGIGTAAPKSKLDINGDVRIQTGLTFADGASSLKPFYIKQFCNIRGGDTPYDTGILKSKYTCWIGGISAHGGTIRTTPDDPIFAVLQKQEDPGTDWELFIDFATTGNDEFWDVTVVCVLERLVEDGMSVGACSAR